MPIRVQCACGKVLRVKEELAGKRVKCPGCGQSVVVQSEADSNASSAAKPEKPGAGKLCSCGALLRADAALCVKCGFDFRTGSHHQHGRVKKTRQQKGILDKALDASAPGLSLLWGVLLFFCILIAVWGLYGIWTTKIGRVIDDVADVNFFHSSFPGGEGFAWACTLGGFAGCSAFGWLLKKSVKRAGDATYKNLIKDLKRQAAATTDPAERAELEKMIQDARNEKDEMNRDLR